MLESIVPLRWLWLPSYLPSCRPWWLQCDYPFTDSERVVQYTWIDDSDPQKSSSLSDWRHSCFRTDVKSPDQAFSVSSEACEWILESRNAEYLKSPTPLKKWYKFGHKIRKGDLVLVSEYRLARVQWSQARVEDTHTGQDGLVRSVTLRTSSGSLIRLPVLWLHLFEACDANLAAELNWTLWISSF